MANMKDDYLIEINRRAKMMRERGNASLYARGAAPEDLPIIENSALQDWLQVANNNLALGITRCEPNPDDPPDFFGYIGNKKINIECTEFVDGALLDKIRAGEVPTIYAGSGFQYAQWDQYKFINHLNECISKKEEKYSKKKIVIDFLIIHSDEHWLHSQKVGNWLDNFDHKQSSTIISAYFLMSYDPQRQTYPVFKLF